MTTSFYLIAFSLFAISIADPAAKPVQEILA